MRRDSCGSPGRSSPTSSSARSSRWNDKAIAELNPGLTLPATPITVVRRSDGSGTTFLFTDYLAKSSAEWKTTVGSATAVAWPEGVGGKGNEGVASYVQRIKGSIGYVEYAYAKRNTMKHVSLRNRDGHFVQPDDEAFQAAVAFADWKSAPGVLPDPHRPGGQGQLADHRRILHPDARAARQAADRPPRF